MKFAKYVPKLIDDIEGWNHPWTKGGNGPPKLFFFFFLIIICVCVLILAILLYKITFYFPLTISLILLRVILYSQNFL